MYFHDFRNITRIALENIADMRCLRIHSIELKINFFLAQWVKVSI